MSSDRLVAAASTFIVPTGESHTVLGAVAFTATSIIANFELLEGVREVMRITHPSSSPAASSSPKALSSISAAVVKIGGPEVVVPPVPAPSNPANKSFPSRKRHQSWRKNPAPAAPSSPVHLPTRSRAWRARSQAHAPKLRQVRPLHHREVMDASQIQMMLGYVDIFPGRRAQPCNYFLLRALGEGPQTRLLEASACPPPWKNC